MRGLGPDTWKRDTDAQVQKAIIKGEKQQKRHAEEWLRRATKALNRGECARAKALMEQALLEMHC